MSPAGAVVPINLQWSLNETADGFYKISKDIIHAATRDDVQATTLDALEKFGTTLAICSDTEYRVEEGLRLARGSRYVAFLKSYVGYATGDSCDALSVSTGGIRMLALAAALTTWDHLEAAKTVREMMSSTTRNHKVLPTLGNLKAAFKALEHKTNRLGFADGVLRWHMKMGELVRILKETNPNAVADPDEENSEDYRADLLSTFHNTCPHPEVLAAVIAAFRDVWRLGEGNMVRITADNSYIWLVAFSEWCIGVAPKVILKSGHIIHDDPLGKSRVEILVEGRGIPVRVEIFAHLDTPSHLWRLDSIIPNHNWSGMVSLRLFAKKVMQECDLDHDKGQRALHQVLKYSTAAVLPEILRQPLNGHPRDRTAGLLRSSSDVKHFAKRIEKIIGEYLGVESLETCQLRQLNEGQEVEDLHNMELYIKTLRAQCECARCGDGTDGPCDIHWFEYSISCITAQILALSIIELTEPVKIYFHTSGIAHAAYEPMELIFKVTGILFPRSDMLAKLPGFEIYHDQIQSLRDGSINLYHIFNLALYLLGHETVLRRGPKPDWIASVYRGQVLYPHFFDSRNIDSRSIMLIDGGPGTILYNEESYSRVVSTDRIGHKNPGQRYFDNGVDRVRNLLDSPDTKLDWQVRHPLTFHLASVRIAQE